ncbi:hypothetical protein [Ferdinandcohnia sp. SAFN-114]|uniref:hypothetical protein n=1 Tax=Ferdinandcohnia sp. SAFN-114 TaxID=3387275 RepID=UPI003F7F0C75
MASYVRSTEYTARITGTLAQFQEIYDAQFAAYDTFRSKLSSTLAQNLFNPISGTALSILFGALGVAKLSIGYTLWDIMEHIASSERGRRADVVFGGARILTYDILPFLRNNNYKAAEIEFLFLEDTMSDGKKIRFIQGPSSGSISGTYVVKRVQTASGVWMTL